MRCNYLIYIFAFILLVTLPHILPAQNMRYTIEGDLRNLGNEKIYLIDKGLAYGLKKDPLLIDSCYSNAGSFKFSGSLKDIGLYSIQIPSKSPAVVNLVLENGTFKVSGDALELFKAKVEGHFQDKVYKRYLNEIDNFYTTPLNRLVDSVFMYRSKGDTITSIKFEKEYTLLEKKYLDDVLSFIKNNTNAYASLLVLNNTIIDRDLGIDTAEHYFNLLSPELKKSPIGQVAAKKIYFYKRKPLEPAPEITGTDVNGKRISSNKFKGRLLLIDFWATWCGPCIAQIPELRRINNKFGDKVVLLSVSLDTDRNKWKEFVNKHKMDWQNICDGLGGRSPINVNFNIRGIPRAVLCDSDGLVIYDSFNDKHNGVNLTTVETLIKSQLAKSSGE